MLFCVFMDVQMFPEHSDWGLRWMVAVIDANVKPQKGRKTPLDLKVLLLGCVHCALMYSASLQKTISSVNKLCQKRYYQA